MNIIYICSKQMSLKINYYEISRKKKEGPAKRGKNTYKIKNQPLVKAD